MSSAARKVFENWLGGARGREGASPSAASDDSIFETVARSLFHPPPESSRIGGIDRAVVDEAFEELSRHHGVRPEPFWPEGKPYALCVTHDIDRILATIQGLRRGWMLRSGGTRRFARDILTALGAGDREANSFFNFGRILRLQREAGFRSAFYVLFERRRWMMAARRGEPQHVVGVYHPRAVTAELEALVAEGNELGLHASFDAWADARQIAREKASLESLVAGPVSGVRNHYLCFDLNRSPAALRDGGFAYDSTMGLNFLNGFRAGTCFPYLWPSGLVELPFQLMDSALRAQAQDPVDRSNIVDSCLHEVRRRGGVLVVNWHLHTMNSEVFPREVELLLGVIERARRDGAWIALPREIVGHWRKRAGGGP